MPLKFAVLGTAHPHVLSFISVAREHNEVELVAISDANPEKCKELKNTYKCPVFNNWQELLDKIQPDAAGCAEINGARGPIAIECARRGIHILADKPLVTKLEELNEIEKIAHENASWLCMIAFTLRFAEEGLTIKNIIDKDMIGIPASFYGCRTYKLGNNRPQWMFDKESYGGIMADIGSHDIDLIRWFFNTEIIKSHSIGRNIRTIKYLDFQDSVQTFMQCANGLSAFLDVNWLAPDKQTGHDRTTIITGSKGILRHDNEKLTLINNGNELQILSPIKTDDSAVKQFFDYCTGKNRRILITTSESLKSARSSLEIQKNIMT